MITSPPLLVYTPSSPVIGPDGKEVNGLVLLEITIGTDGTVKVMKVLRGPDELAQSARDAVENWQYAKACLNGAAIPIIQVISVVFGPNRQSPIPRSPIANRQSVDRQSAIGNRH